MAPRLSERLKAILFAVVLVGAIAGLYAVVQALQPPPVPSAVVRAVHLDIDGFRWKAEYGPATTTNNTVFGLLIEASIELGFDVEYVPYEIPQGMFVTAINDTVNGSGGLYWQYWVNGLIGQVAADKQALFDGDHVLWKFTAPEQGA